MKQLKTWFSCTVVFEELIPFPASPQSFPLMYFDFRDSSACVSLQCTIFYNKHSSEENQYRTGELNSGYERLNTFSPMREVCVEFFISPTAAHTQRMFTGCVRLILPRSMFSYERTSKHREPLLLFSSWHRSPVPTVQTTVKTAQQKGRSTRKTPRLVFSLDLFCRIYKPQLNWDSAPFMRTNAGERPMRTEDRFNKRIRVLFFLV